MELTWDYIRVSLIARWVYYWGDSKVRFKCNSLWWYVCTV